MVDAPRPDVEPRPREALLLGPADGLLGALAAGLMRRGISARVMEHMDAAHGPRLLTPRPDFIVLDVTATTQGRWANDPLATVRDGRRALAIPVLLAIGSGTTPRPELLVQADDILLPPHDPAEAVLRAALAVHRRGDSAAHLVSAGALTVDVDGFRAWLAGEPVTLTYTEFQLLRLLVLNRGKVLTRQVLLNKIWGYDYLGGLRTVDVHIRRLRAKTESKAPALIETVRHVGYRIGE